MEFVVTDRSSVERGLLVRSAYVVVSIRDPKRRKARIPRQPGLRDVLDLAFHDAEPSPYFRLPENIVVMDENQAGQIWRFVRENEARVGAVVVHCEQGMSRSPAVAAALCREYGGDERFYFRCHQPNRYVYELMNRTIQTGRR